MGCGLSIALMSLPKVAARVSALGPLLGVTARFGGTIEAMTSRAVARRGRWTASAAVRVTRSRVSVYISSASDGVSAPASVRRRTE